MKLNRMRQNNFTGFFASTLAPIVASRGAVDACPLIGIDESLNNEHVGARMSQLVGVGLVRESEPLWYKLRECADGTQITVAGGSISPSPLVPDVGREVRNWSCPDEHVVSMLVVKFTRADRLCLLTRDSKKDWDGLYNILHREVKPALEALTPARLGLLVLCQTPGSEDLEGYARGVVTRLLTGGVSAGFSWEEIT